MRAKPRRRRGERANKLAAKPVKFRLVAITGRSSNLFRATISALTGRNPAQHFPPQSAFGGQSRRAKIPFPRPLSFLPACLGFALKNFEASGGLKIKGKKRSIALAPPSRARATGWSSLDIFALHF